MKITETLFEGLYLVESTTLLDDRGIFMKPWISKNLNDIFGNISEIYMSTSYGGVFRGLHFQKGKTAQKKFVMCLQGAIEDIALDLRKDSKTYGKFFRHRLDGMNGIGIMVPEGFAHGVYAHTNSIMLNICNQPYSPEDEDGVSYKSFPELNDLNIKIVSTKDAELKIFTNT